MAKISVIMPAYNAGSFIYAAVSSIFSQTFKDWELIVVDDGSSDDTLFYLEPFLRYPHVRLLQQEHLGNNAARNLAIASANGQYILYQDADDISLPNRLSTTLHNLEETNNTGCFTPLTTFGAGSKVLPYPSSSRYIKAHLLWKNTVAQPSMLIKANALQQLDAEPYPPALEAMGDYNLWWNLTKRGASFSCIRQPLVRYRLWEGQVGVKLLKKRDELRKVFFRSRLFNAGFQLEKVEYEVLYNLLYHQGVLKHGKELIKEVFYHVVAQIEVLDLADKPLHKAIISKFYLWYALKNRTYYSLLKALDLKSIAFVLQNEPYLLRNFGKYS